MIYSEIARQRNQALTPFSYHLRILKRNQMRWRSTDTRFFLYQGSGKLSVSKVSNGEAFSIIRIFSAEEDTLVGGVMFDQNLDKKKFSIGDWGLVKYDSTNYPGEILQIVNNQFQVNVMSKNVKFWRRPQKEDKIFCTSHNIVKHIEAPQVAGLCRQFDFHQI